MPVKDYMEMENRFKMLSFSKPAVAKKLADLAQNDVDQRWALYEYMANRHAPNGKDTA
jgi:pyruvate-ferredoxin/flavodoxin oxidoreductase